MTRDDTEAACWRDAIVWRLANAALRLATPRYRKLIPNGPKEWSI